VFFGTGSDGRLFRHYYYYVLLSFGLAVYMSLAGSVILLKRVTFNYPVARASYEE